MQTVSQAWKDNQREPFVSMSEVEITLEVGDPDARADASASDNGGESWADTPQIVDETQKSPVPYATLELNQWILGRHRPLLPTQGPFGDNGYVGSWLSGADGKFSAPYPTITLSFSKVFTNVIPGLTITWATAYGEWASSIRITAYNGQTVTAQKTFEDNLDMTTVAEIDIETYNKITVEILEWSLPYRRARIENILPGIMKTYGKSDLFSAVLDLNADPLSASLPKSELTFELNNVDLIYNPDNPSGVVKYMLQRQSITARCGYWLNGAVEWIPMGTFYMSEWESPQNSIKATLAARDALEFMDALYSGPVTGTLMQIATAALEQAELPLLPDGSVRWQLDSSLSSISTPSSVELDDDVTIAEILQLCANAACCALFQDRAGIFHITPVGTSQTDYLIDRYVSYSASEIALGKQLKAVDINSGQYTLSVGTVGNIQRMENPLISNTQAPVVAQWVAALLQNRRKLSAQYRADPRMDPLDRVTVQNQFSSSIVLISNAKYTYNGAFRGEYEGRAIAPEAS